MFTNHTFEGKKYQFNTDASFKMGKDKFIAQYKGKVPNALKAWEAIETDANKGEKAPKNKVEKAPQTK